MPSQIRSQFDQIRLARRSLLCTVAGAVLVGVFTNNRHRSADAQVAGLATPNPLGPAIPPGAENGTAC